MNCSQKKCKDISRKGGTNAIPLPDENNSNHPLFRNTRVDIEKLPIERLLKLRKESVNKLFVYKANASSVFRNSKEWKEYISFIQRMDVRINKLKVE